METHPRSDVQSPNSIYRRQGFHHRQKSWRDESAKRAAGPDKVNLGLQTRTGAREKFSGLRADETARLGLSYWRSGGLAGEHASGVVFVGCVFFFTGFHVFFTRFSRGSAVVFAGYGKRGCFFIFLRRREILTTKSLQTAKTRMGTDGSTWRRPKFSMEREQGKPWTTNPAVCGAGTTAATGVRVVSLCIAWSLLGTPVIRLEFFYSGKAEGPGSGPQARGGRENLPGFFTLFRAFPPWTAQYFRDLRKFPGEDSRQSPENIERESLGSQELRLPHPTHRTGSAKSGRRRWSWRI